MDSNGDTNEKVSTKIDENSNGISAAKMSASKILNKLKKPSKWKCNKNFVTERMEKLFYKHGLLVGKYPYAFLVVPFVIMCALSFGILTVRICYDLYQAFAPSNALSASEYRVFLDFFDDTGLFFFCLGITAKDGGNLLRNHYRQDVLSMVRYFETNYTVAIEGRDYTFEQLRINHADDNKILKIALEYYNASKFPMKLTYPVLTLNNEFYYLGTNLRNVTVDPETNLIKDMGAVIFMLNSAKGDERHTVLLRQWALSFLNMNKTLDAFPNLNMYYWSDDVNAIEITRNSFVMTPYVIFGFGMLILFAGLISWSKNPVLAKPWESLVSIFCVVLSCGASFGIVFASGHEFHGIILTCPVLVLALGMDVTYITLRTWQNTDRNTAPQTRLAETLSEAGPSIIITTLTNLLSAALGCMTNVPATYVFCLILGIAVLFLFFLQITIFAAAISLGAVRESKNMHGFLCCKKVSFKDKAKPSQSHLPDVVSSTTKSNDWWNYISMILSYALCTKYCRILVSISLIIYLSSAIYCCTRVKIGLNPERLVVPDSSLIRMIKLDRDTMQSGNGDNLFVIVSNPPNINNPSELLKMEQMVKDFENLTDCLGTNATAVWLRPFQQYLDFLDDTNDTVSVLKEYINKADGTRWKNYIFFDKNDNSTISRFMFTVVYKRTKDFIVRSRYTDDWRAVCSKYKQYNVSTWFYDNYNFITDQLEAIGGNIIQDLVITGVCMSLVCIAFIPNIFSTACSVLTIFSINVGVFGFINNWDANLDPVTMTAFIISVGYSVDFTSHITFHYYISDGITQQRKLYTAISSIGLPMLETGLSTLICVGCIALAGGYMITVFVKSIFLVVLIGLIHGLIILPTFLAWIPINVLDKLFASRKHEVHEPPVATLRDKKPEIIFNKA